MPHDKNGHEIKAGDVVTVECVVKNVQPGTDYCNATLETVEPMYPGEHKTGITVNARQVVKIGLVLIALFLFAGSASAGPCKRDRGGPVRNLVGAVADRVHERREARAGAACSTCAPAPQPPQVLYAPGSVSAPAASSCPGGRCPIPK